MKLGRFLTTLGIGAIAGMLFAPKKGRNKKFFWVFYDKYAWQNGRGNPCCSCS